MQAKLSRRRDGRWRAASLSDVRDATEQTFRLFREIGIISQLSESRLQAVLPHGLTAAQFSLLDHCVRLGDGWPPARLAAAFQVTRGTMTNTLQKLEVKGFIRIGPDPVDGRAKRVFLTERGREAREEGLAVLAPELTLIGQVLGSRQIAALLPALEKLRIWMDSHR
jgi:DNA-binding MarR family transcriptional regulator